MTIYYKATKLDGTDFHSGTVDYAAALESGERIDIGAAARRLPAACCTDTVLHASTVPTETLIGGAWPCRLFEVSGRPVASAGRKRGFRSLRVVREVDAHMALGPQGAEAAALIERLRRLTDKEIRLVRTTARDAAGNAARVAARNAAWVAARYAAWDAAVVAAGDAAWDAAGDAARDAAWDAAWALVIRDLIGQHGFGQQHYDTLTMPLRKAGITVHPDDEAVDS